MKNILITLLTFITLTSVAQQDKSISMWYQSPMMYNAGSVATGAEDFGFFTNFRMQWLPLTKMRTNVLNANFKIPDGFMGSNNFGLGLNVMQDVTAGGVNNLSYTTNMISIPINYTLALDNRNKLSLGVSPGFIQQSYTPNHTWEDQWQGSGFTGTSSETGFNSSFSTIDISTGLFYQHSMRNRTLLYGGVALNHINKPKLNFSFGSDRLYMQTVVHAGANIVTRKRDLRVNPQLMYFQTGPGSNIVAGLSLEHILKEGSSITTINKTVTVDYGFYYRHLDALITTFGFKFKGFRMGIAFDANLSSLNQATNSIGAIEIYLKTLHLYKKSNKRGKIK